jgi:hypothetical protein
MPAPSPQRYLPHRARLWDAPLVVEDFNSFADAMANKLAKEIDVAGGDVGKRVALLK